MKGKCPTCPFNKNENGRDAAPEIADMVRRRCLTEASQICHHPRLHGKKVKETEVYNGRHTMELTDRLKNGSACSEDDTLST